jgi:hypothetical protein
MARNKIDPPALDEIDEFHVPRQPCRVVDIDYAVRFDIYFVKVQRRGRRCAQEAWKGAGGQSGTHTVSK